MISAERIVLDLPSKTKASVLADVTKIADDAGLLYDPRDLLESLRAREELCSTGLGNSTPRGIYLDGGPVNVWHHFSKFDCWARYSFEIDGDRMFHSVIYSERDTDTLRESSLYGLGNKASHGCVRLAVKSAKWLFEHCAPGSFVIIIY